MYKEFYLNPYPEQIGDQSEDKLSKNNKMFKI